MAVSFDYWEIDSKKLFSGWIEKEQYWKKRIKQTEDIGLRDKQYQTIILHHYLLTIFVYQHILRKHD